jgi:OsmC subfamily peroxiredoxin
MIRRAKAFWYGTGRAGSGHLSSDSGVLAETPYSFRTRFENEKGTNPEELIAAAHAGCFTMALAFGLQGAGFTRPSSAPRPQLRLSKKDKDFAVARRSPCAQRCRTLTKGHLSALPARPRRIARCPRCSTPRSHWTPSWSSECPCGQQDALKAISPGRLNTGMCGFVDQSRLARIFSKSEGGSPGRWRRLRRC